LQVRSLPGSLFCHLGIGVGVDTGGIGIGITMYKPLTFAFVIKQIIDYVILVFTLIRGLYDSYITESSVFGNDLYKIIFKIIISLNVKVSSRFFISCRNLKQLQSTR
jgi:hypothetical protein